VEREMEFVIKKRGKGSIKFGKFMERLDNVKALYLQILFIYINSYPQGKLVERSLKLL